MNHSHTRKWSTVFVFTLANWKRHVFAVTERQKQNKKNDEAQKIMKRWTKNRIKKREKNSTEKNKRADSKATEWMSKVEYMMFLYEFSSWPIITLLLPSRRSSTDQKWYAMALTHVNNSSLVVVNSVEQCVPRLFSSRREHGSCHMTIHRKTHTAVNRAKVHLQSSSICDAFMRWWTTWILSVFISKLMTPFSLFLSLCARELVFVQFAFFVVFFFSDPKMQEIFFYCIRRLAHSWNLVLVTQSSNKMKKMLKSACISTKTRRKSE